MILTTAILPFSAEVEPTAEMQHLLAAVSYGEDVAGALQSNVCGYVQVKQVEPQKVHLLSPCPGKLPGTVVLVSDVSCLDH